MTRLKKECIKAGVGGTLGNIAGKTIGGAIARTAGHEIGKYGMKGAC